MQHLHPKAQRLHQKQAAKSARNAAMSESASRTALVLGGGAPNSALMAGALAAFEDQRVRFDVVTSSGAGGLVSLLWLAPRDAAPSEALRNWIEAYVDDRIYRQFPVDYKVFHKPGPWADWSRTLFGGALLGQSGGFGFDQALPRFWRDWTQLMTATLTPSAVTPNSLGLCARVPWAEKLVDFDRIRDIEPYFYLNAYNIDQEIMEDFSKEEITPDHFRAAFAFPFIYGPYQMGEDHYYEAASHDALNFRDLVEKHTGLETIVVLDVLGSSPLVRRPRNLYDSWVQSMIIPLVKVAESNLELFALKHNNGWRRSEGAKSDLLVLPFDVPEDDLPEVLDWSYSNGKRLFTIGYDSALAFLDRHGDRLFPHH
ncbi:patatin-like phospholipase family protein [Phaeospirillum tilakii]|uniref:Patatin-like phospholipase family protein n=1 Tax=Phaeospirillum tilakii TaxID=741673 RepID=A0ABW5CA73_9PROT